jgi:hypothetical protein
MVHPAAALMHSQRTVLRHSGASVVVHNGSQSFHHHGTWHGFLHGWSCCGHGKGNFKWDVLDCSTPKHVCPAGGCPQQHYCDAGCTSVHECDAGCVDRSVAMTVSIVALSLADYLNFCRCTTCRRLPSEAPCTLTESLLVLPPSTAAERSSGENKQGAPA